MKPVKPVKIDMSRKAVTLRLTQVSKLRRACLELAKSSKGTEIRASKPANKTVQRTSLALGHGPVRQAYRMNYNNWKNKQQLIQEEAQMDWENQLSNSVTAWGADYFGIADLTPAHDAEHRVYHA